MSVLGLAVILVCGFIYTTLNLKSRYRQLRSSGWGTYFHVAAWGLLFTFLGIVVTEILDLADVPTHILSQFWPNPVQAMNDALAKASNGEVNPREMCIAASSITLALFFGGIAAFVHRNPSKRLDTLLKICVTDGVEYLVAESMKFGRLISVTLESRKCYVGFAYKDHSDRKKMDSLALIPILSGYRDENTLELVVTRNYHDYYVENDIVDWEGPNLSISDFRVVIPLSRVVQLSLFDIETYVKFNPHNPDGSDRTAASDTAERSGGQTT